jgi:hypothetical protein
MLGFKRNKLSVNAPVFFLRRSLILNSIKPVNNVKIIVTTLPMVSEYPVKKEIVATINW